MAQTLKIVKQDTVYETIHSYITDSSKSVTNYEEMIEVVLDMIREGHCFLMDRDILRDCLETLTFMYEPNDDMNKDRVVLQLIDIDDDDEDDGEEGGMDMLKNLGKMMGMPDMGDMMKEASATEDATSTETEDATSAAPDEETSAATEEETSTATEEETSAETEEDTSAETEEATTNSEDQ